MDKKVKKSSVIFALLSAMMMVFIFSKSLSNGESSSNDSSFVVNLLTKYIIRVDDPDSINMLTIIVRKLAHFLEFALLFSLINGLMISLTHYKNKAYMFITLFAVIFVPLVDETIQYLSPGRTPMVYDIWVDMAGGLFGIFVSAIIFCICVKKRKKKLKDKIT